MFINTYGANTLAYITIKLHVKFWNSSVLFEMAWIQRYKPNLSITLFWIHYNFCELLQALAIDRNACTPFNAFSFDYKLFPHTSHAMVHSYVLQDIYDLKDQIHDVEGRYMQGLKELKVSGLFPSMHFVWVFLGNGDITGSTNYIRLY